METQRPPQPKPEKPFLMQMSIQTEGKGKSPHFKNVRIYSIKNPDDPRPFVVKDSDGNEVELEPNDQFIVEKQLFGTASPETLQRLEEQRKKLKAHSRR